MQEAQGTPEVVLVFLAVFVSIQLPQARFQHLGVGHTVQRMVVQKTTVSGDRVLYSIVVHIPIHYLIAE